MRKTYLMTPGPTPVASSTLLTMAQPVIHHRTGDYERIFSEVREGLKYLFRTQSEVLMTASSATGAMEGAVSNTLSPGDRALVIRGGKFGERWAEICEAYGVTPVCIDVEWGKAVRPEQVFRALDEDPGIRAVLVQASETSTGVKHPVQEIGENVRKRDDTLLIVDGVTAIGVFDIQTDAWGLDIVVSGSQKAVMLPPGLAFVSVSAKAWDFMNGSTLPRFYFDFRKEWESAQKNQNAFTPAVSLIVGLHETLQMIRGEGLEAVFQRHAKMARATTEAVRALGFSLLAPESRSEALTAVEPPPGMDAPAISRHLWERYGVRVAGGQGQLKGKILRIAHMGYMDAIDVIVAVSAIEMTLKDLGHAVPLGKGVAAAEEILAKGA